MHLEARGKGILEDVRSEQVEGMGSWALGRLRNDRVTGWREDGQGDQGWSEQKSESWGSQGFSMIGACRGGLPVFKSGLLNWMNLGKLP